MSERVSDDLLRSISADGDFKLDMIDLYRIARECLEWRE